MSINDDIIHLKAFERWARGKLERIAPGGGGVISGGSVGDHGSHHESGGSDEISHGDLAGLTTGDPHTQYRLEADNHTHQSSGAQAGTLDHGLALTGLTDDDHTIYLKEKASGGVAAEVPTHNHTSAGEGGAITSALDDLTDVTITAVATGNRLRYNGTAWVNSTLIWQPLTNGDATTPEILFADGDVIMVEV